MKYSSSARRESFSSWGEHHKSFIPSRPPLSAALEKSELAFRPQEATPHPTAAAVEPS